jgi:hypothetical protein
MPHFYFHLVSPGAYDVDDCGSDFPDTDAAYLDAHATALEISFELLRGNRDPHRYQFEIVDECGHFLMEVHFSDVLRSKRPVTHTDVVADLRRKMHRCAQLRRELTASMEETQSALRTARATLARARSWQGS